MAVEERPDDSLDADQCPGFDLSISEICHALKIKLAQTRDSRHSFPLPLVKSVAGDLSTTVSLLRRMINYHDSWIHRLPPKILAMMASHLEDDTSLVAATHVRHLWRTALLSSPRLWSHLDFDNEKRALAFLERSKFGPVTVDFTESRKLLEVARGTLKEITSRVTILQVSHDSFLDELLAQPMSGLQALEIIDSDRLWPEKPAHLPLTNPGLPLHLYPRCCANPETSRH